MAINKKLIHFNSYDVFNSKKLSANVENTKYTIGVSDTVYDVEEGSSVDILYHSICWIKDTQQLWTHGLIYYCSLNSDSSDTYVWEYKETVTLEEYNSLQSAKNIIIKVEEEFLVPTTYGRDLDGISILLEPEISKMTFGSWIAINIFSDLSVIREVVFSPYSYSIQGTLNITNLSSIYDVQHNITSHLAAKTFIVTDSNGNYPSPNVSTVYIDNEDLWLDLFHRGNDDALKYLLKTKEAYYYFKGVLGIGAGWYSKNISLYVKLPLFHLQTAKVGDLVTIIRQEYTPEEFYSKYIDFNSINLTDDERDSLNLYLSQVGISTSLSDGEAIKQLIVQGHIYSAESDPNNGATTHPLVVDDKVVLYTAHITPNTQNIYSGEFWVGNMTGPGIYSYITSGRPDGSDSDEFYTGYVSPDGRLTLISMKDPSKVFTRPNISSSWTKLSMGIGKNTGGTGEIFNDYVNNVAHSDHAHAEGQKCRAISYNAHAEGYNTEAHWNAHSEGNTTVASGQNSHAEGEQCQATNYNAHAEGFRTRATGNGAHAEGNSDGIDDETRWNVASGMASHTEGTGTQATNNASHAEGLSTSSYGLGSHSEGMITVAKGDGSHSEGGITLALGGFSHAEGFCTLTNNTGEHAEGKYNYYEIDNLIHSVGIGDHDSENLIDSVGRVNAHAITLDGKHYIYGIGGYLGLGITNAQDLATVINNIPTRSTIFKDFRINKTYLDDWVLIADITDLLNLEEGGLTYGFTGMYNYYSENSLGETGFITVQAYYKKELWSLKHTGSLVKPYIVKYDPDNLENPSKYWLVLSLQGDGKYVDFIGTNENLLDSFITVEGSSSISEYFEVIAEPETYLMPGIGVNVQAVDTSITLDDIDINTYLKYTTQSLSDSEKELSRINIGLQNLYNWYNLLPENTITGYQKHLIGAGSYPYVATSSTVVTLQPNVFYNLGEVNSSLNITLSSPEDTSITNEYMFLFKALNDNVSISISPSQTWHKLLEIEANKTYLISILNNFATYLDF